MRSAKKYSKNEKGLASIVVVGLLIILLTLITIGFARIMTRSVQNATSNEAAASASYAAQSGLNDLADYLRTNPNVKSTKCNELIQDASGNKGPFFNDANLSGDNNTRYTCLLVNQRPTDLVYQNITNLKSKVIKLTTDTVAGSVDSFMFSWQSRDPSKNVTPNPSVDFINETSWNNSNYIPMLRVTLYPITTSGALDDNVQNNSRTIYLIPSNAGGPPSKTIDYLSITNGEKKRVKCDTGAISGFTGSADYACNFVINSLASDKVANIDYYYVRITPIYNNVDIKVKGNDVDNRAVKFKNVQAVLDVTAKAGPAAKRLQSRVDIAGIDAAGTVTPSPNLSSALDEGPDFSIRSANALCKRHKITNDVYDYLTNEGTCPTGLTGSGAGVYTPPPQLTMNINGVDSQTNTPSPSGYFGTSYISNGGTAQINWNTVDATSCVASGSGWSGEKKGSMAFTPAGLGSGSQSFPGITLVTEYILTCTGPGTGVSPGVSRTVRAWPPPRVSISGPISSHRGDNFNLSWTVANSINCTASGDWSGNKNSANGSHSESQSTSWNDRADKSYTITCSDPSGRTASDTYTNRVDNIGPPIGDPTPAEDGKALPPRCTVNRWFDDNGADTGTGTYLWSGSCPTIPAGSANYQIYGDANLSWQTPSGGNNTGTPWRTSFEFGFRVSAGDWGIIKDTGLQRYTITAPTCNADANVWNNQDGTVSFSWNASCPAFSPGEGYYEMITPDFSSLNPISASGGPYRSGYTPGKEYCIQMRAGVSPWGWQVTSEYKCATATFPAVVINDFYVLAWDNGPYQCGPWAGADNNTWTCRNGDPYIFYPADGGIRASTRGEGGGYGCDDAGHRFSVCAGDIYINSSNATSCKVRSNNGPFGPTYGGGAQWSSSTFRWVGVGGVYAFYVDCYGPTPGPSGPTNQATRCWNGGSC